MKTALAGAEKPALDLLTAFETFRDASFKLEQQYALLEQKVKDLNEELAEKNRAMERTRRLAAMGEMAARIAHEIRNPLGSIAIFASILERDLSEDPKKKDLASHITKGINTLNNILSNMLLFASSPMARLKSVDVREVIEDTVLLTKGHEKKGVTVKTSFDGKTELMADPGLLHQLFLNLLLNAMDALDEGGSIEIRTRIEHGERELLVAEVQDNGKGIPKEALDRIFDPFFTTKDRGTGLGLAIVSAVATAHNGTIDAKSGPGMGTVFTIKLPVAA